MDAVAAVRKHRLVFFNVYPDKEWIEAKMKEEVSGPILVLEFQLEHDVHYQGMVLNGGMMPQRIMIFLVNYEEVNNPKKEGM